jgi:hypothetical protein
MTREKWLKVAKGAGIAMGGALIAYIPEAVGMIDWGTWTPFAVMGGSILVNALRLLIQK